MGSIEGVQKDSRGPEDTEETEQEIWEDIPELKNCVIELT